MKVIPENELELLIERFRPMTPTEAQTEDTEELIDISMLDDNIKDLIIQNLQKKLAEVYRRA